jgi:ribonuclease Y
MDIEINKGGAPVTGYIIAAVIVVILLVLTALISWKSAISYHIKVGEAKVGSAEEKAREIIDEALKTAETKKREALLEAKEENLKTKNDLDKEIKERRAEVQRYEKRVLGKEETLDKKMDALEKRESKLNAKEQSFEKEKQKVEELRQSHMRELEKISGLTSEQAKEYLLKTVEEDVKHETAVMVKELERQAKDEADKKAKDLVVTAIQKCAADHVSETTISVVPLPNDEMKGRIIGREGRNIRTLENLTGIDLIIDDTPEAVILSGFDPIRREVARIALEKLIVDGRIHPARIEEMVEKAKKEVETMIREEGEEAALEVGVHGIHPELIRLLGKMRFRTSYGQNALKHSIEVAHLSGLLAGEVGADVRMAKRAGLLHDIGKSVDHDMEGSHIQLGADLCRKFKESALVVNAVEAHHGDVEAESMIACLVQAADAISAARPGARRETLETYTNRLKQLEDISNGFEGVDKSFAIQAGREVRVMVIPDQINDDEMVLLARDLSKQIEAELQYPGQIKVNVIRESRVVDYAK